MTLVDFCGSNYKGPSQKFLKKLIVWANSIGLIEIQWLEMRFGLQNKILLIKIYIYIFFDESKGFY